MRAIISYIFSTVTLYGLMTSYAHAGISITTESLWYVIPSALIFLGMMGITGLLKPEHVQFHEIKPSNSSGAAVIMRWITMIPALFFVVSLVWGVGSAYGWF